MALIHRILKLLRWNLGLVALAIFTVLLGVFLLWMVIVPAYREPTNRTYPTRFGYPALMRKLGWPMPVTTAIVERRRIQKIVLGEGMLASEPILVPVIAMDRITAVHVHEGDRVTKGQLLAELDSSAEQIKLSSTEIALSTAKAELERVHIGSAYVLAQERPTKDIINAEAAKKQMELLSQRRRMLEELRSKGAVSENEIIDIKLQESRAKQDFDMAQFNLSMSSKGVDQSVNIAEDAVKEAENARQHRLQELKGYKVYAPADGIIERVLIHEGEYNQEPGKPGFIIASDLWFEAHPDQAAMEDIHEGCSVDVQLEALPGEPIPGKVRRIIPIVSFNTGGPESSRPIRPLGTGAPEWPSTFTVQVTLDAPGDKKLVPGMTGFARLRSTRETTAVPQGSVLSLSAGSGLIHVLTTAGRQVREVRCGATDNGWTQIISGVSIGEKVIVSGQEILEANDKIREQPMQVVANP